jgi:hypothetical protein
MPGTHAKLAPSSAHRWLRCKASVGFVQRLRAEGRIPQEDSSSYADEGTVAHDWAAKALVAWRDKAPFDYALIPDQVMANHVRSWVDLVSAKVSGPGQLWIEHRMPLFYQNRGPADQEVKIAEMGKDFWFVVCDPEMAEWGPFLTYDEAKVHFIKELAPQGYWVLEYGTADAVVLNEEGLYIFDLKYGVGVSVEARENDQLGIYAESFIREQKLRDRLPPQFAVEPTIFQPRDRDNSLPPVREWFTTLGELGEISETTAAVAEELFAGNCVRAFNPGKKQCRFCPAKALCTAKAQSDLGVLAEVCETIPESIEGVVSGPWISPEKLGDSFYSDTLARIVVAYLEGDLDDWLKSAVGYVKALILEGEKFEGLKAVKGEKHRTWTDEEAALRLLRQKVDKDKLVKEKLVSPSAAWDLLPKDVSTKFRNKLTALIIKPEGDLTVALASDKRPAVEVAAKSVSTEFPDLEEEDLC